MAPQVGLEPTTLRLTAGCSAIELLRSIAGKMRPTEAQPKAARKTHLLLFVFISASAKHGQSSSRPVVKVIETIAARRFDSPVLTCYKISFLLGIRLLHRWARLWVWEPGKNLAPFAAGMGWRRGQTSQNSYLDVEARLRANSGLSRELG